MQKELEDAKEIIKEKDKVLRTVLAKVQAMEDPASIKEENTKLKNSILQLEIELRETKSTLQKQNLQDLSTNAIAIQMVNSMQTRVVLSTQVFNRLSKVLIDSREPLKQQKQAINNILDAMDQLVSEEDGSRDLVNEVMYRAMHEDSLAGQDEQEKENG